MSTSQARILLCEDDREMRRLVAEFLEAAGYAVLQIADGLTLSRLLENPAFRQTTPVDVLITDVRMPGASGLEVLGALRRSDWATPVVVMTAFGDDELKAEAARLGCTAFIDKPFDPQILVEVVQETVPPRVDRPPR